MQTRTLILGAGAAAGNVRARGNQYASKIILRNWNQLLPCDSLGVSALGSDELIKNYHTRKVAQDVHPRAGYRGAR